MKGSVTLPLSLLQPFAVAGLINVSAVNATQPGTIFQDPTIALVASQPTAARRRAIGEELASRDISATEIIGRARSMMGGDSSDMLDL